MIATCYVRNIFFFSSRRRHTRSTRDWSSDVCSSDLSLDGGNSSSHGYVVAASVPAGAVRILSRTNPAEYVLYAYPYGRGWVVYSTMPLDFYLTSTSTVGLNFRNVYAPNVIAYARELRQRPRVATAVVPDERVA